VRELKQQRRETEQRVAVMVGKEEVQVLRDTHKVRRMGTEEMRQRD